MRASRLLLGLGKKGGVVTEDIVRRSSAAGDDQFRLARGVASSFNGGLSLLTREQTRRVMAAQKKVPLSGDTSMGSHHGCALSCVAGLSYRSF